MCYQVCSKLSVQLKNNTQFTYMHKEMGNLCERIKAHGPLVFYSVEYAIFLYDNILKHDIIPHWQILFYNTYGQRPAEV